MSDTPRTDAHIKENYATLGHAVVCHDFARQLEQELNELRRVAEELAEELVFLCILTVGNTDESKALAAYKKLKNKT